MVVLLPIYLCLYEIEIQLMFIATRHISYYISSLAIDPLLLLLLLLL